MKRKTNLYALLLIYLVVAMAGCAGMGGTQNPDEMSPKEVALWANRNYDAQKEAYLQDFKYGKNNPIMQDMLNTKRELLIHIHPFLLTYNEILLDGKVPGPTVTNELVRLIYELTGVY